MLSILNGKREEIINETPVEYSNLYTECWKYEPNERPNMREIFLTLKATVSSEIIICNFNENKKNVLKYKSNSESSKVIIHGYKQRSKYR
ncbi:unnamed protein product [Rhizophagus irregularis]|nr:unnamed protein product [Rhizophagus irregularis]